MDIHFHIEKKTAIVVLTAVIAGAIAGGIAGAAVSHEGREHGYGGRMGMHGYDMMQGDQADGETGNVYYSSASAETSPAPTSVSVQAVPAVPATK